MFKLFISLWISLTIDYSVYCQTKIDSMFITKTINNVVFVSKDTIQKFTKIVQQDGAFNFIKSPIDSVYLENGQVYISYFPDKIRYYKIIINYINRVDTIYNYFSDNETERINNELTSSYILKQLKEPIKLNHQQEFIRLLYPKDDLNPCKDYVVFRICYSRDSVKLYRIIGQSFDSNGIQIIRVDSSELKKKDFERIKKQLSKIKSDSETNCRYPGNPMVLKYLDKIRDKNFFLSYYCLRGKRNFRPVTRLCFLIMEISNKYLSK